MDGSRVWYSAVGERCCAGIAKDIDGYGSSALEGYSVIQGTLGVGYEVYELDALYCLTRITGALYLVESEVASLDGLAALEEVGGELELGMSGQVEEAVFPALDNVGFLSIYYNDNLANLEMPALQTVYGGIEVQDNPKLPTCDVVEIIENLEYLGGEAYVSGNMFDDCSQ